MIGRRSLLAGLGAMLVMPAWARRGEAVATPDALRLGWRWIPGDTLVYETLTTYRRPGSTSERLERWSYLVVDRTREIASLEGHLIGLGGARDASPPTAALGAERRRGASIQLRLGVDGRLRPRPSDACETIGEASADCFEHQLPHRLLALPLPTEPVRIGRSWSDPELQAAFAPLLGAPDRPLERSTGSCALSEIYRRPDGDLRADLRTTVLLRAGSGLALRAEGRSSWDPDRGVLAERRIEARVGGTGSTLEVRLRRIE